MSAPHLSLGDRLGQLLAARASGGDPALLQRATRAIGEALALGHVCCQLQDLAEAADLAALRQQLLATGVVGSGAIGSDADTAAPAPLWLDHSDRLYLRRHFQAEQGLALALRARLQTGWLPVPAAAIEALRASATPLPAGDLDWQGIAVLAALHSPFAVITGGPGTGKTTTVARLLTVLLRTTPTLRIALAAPTGKAASRLCEAVLGRLRALGTEPPALRAFTLHRLLGYLPLADEFRRDARSPLPHDLVVVDEASMVDLELMHALLQALPATARLVLLGDQDQLSSVAAGQVLGDLCRAASVERGVGTALASLCNAALGQSPPSRADDLPLANAVVALRRNYRFAAQPGLAAFAAATAGGDADAALAALLHGHDELQWAPLPACPDDLLAPIAAQLLQQLQADSPAAALANLQRLRILCATRHGPFGVVAQNQGVERMLLRAGHRTQQRYYQGQPLLITANDHQNRLYNGDLGVCWPDAEHRMQVWFATGGEPRSVLPLRLPPHETAWAMTVHKSQGSEFDEVLVVLPDRDGPLLHASLLYTAVTRARARAHVRGDLSLIKAMLQRQPVRRSGLVDAMLGS